MSKLRWAKMICLAAMCLSAQEIVDISNLLSEPADSSLSSQIQASSSSQIADTVISITSSSSSRPPLIRQMIRTASTMSTVGPIYANKGPLTLALLDGPGHAWYNLGVLEAIEMYRIPVDRILGAGWGAWVGAVWAEGYSTRQIREWLQSADTLAPDWIWGKPSMDSAIPSTQGLTKAVTTSGVPALGMGWTLARDSGSSLPTLQTWQPVSGHDMARTSLANLLLQQPLLSRLLQGNAADQKPARLPWNAILCDEKASQIVFSAERPAVEWVIASLGIHPTQVGQVRLAPMEHCGIVSYDSLNTRWPNREWMFASSWPEQDPNTSSNLLRLAVEMSEKSSNKYALWMRPHWVPTASLRNADDWERQGRDAVRAKLGNLRGYGLVPKDWDQYDQSVASLDLVQPGYEDVSSEYQNHLASFWPEAGSWQNNVADFARGIGESGLYDSLSMELATQQTTDLEDGRDLTVPVLAVRAEPTPQFTWAAGGYGSTLLGPTFDIQGRLRFVNQFEYDFSAHAQYGEYLKGVTPTVTLSRIHGGALSFTGTADIGNWNFEPFFNRIPNAMLPALDRIMLEETRRDFTAGVHWLPSKAWELHSNVRIGSQCFRTRFSEYLFNEGMRSSAFVNINTLNGNVEIRQADLDSVNWFTVGTGSKGKALMGFHSVSIQAMGKGTAPLYGQYEVAWNYAQAIAPALQANLQLQAGIQGRFNSSMTWLYPDSLELISGGRGDRALTDYFKMRVATPFGLMLPLPEYTSEHFASAGASLGWHHNGNGLWIYGLLLQDFTGLDNGIGNRRLTLDPLLRWHWRSIEILTGIHLTADWDNLKNFGKSSRWTWITQVGLVAF